MNRAKRTIPNTKSAPVVEKLRTVCLSLPETSERSSWGHPNFLAGKKTFVTFEHIQGRPSIAFKLDPVDNALLTRDQRFFATPYGRGQWVSVWVDIAFDWSEIRDLVVRAYRLAADGRAIKP